jgi:hypothetical protein
LNFDDAIKMKVATILVKSGLGQKSEHAVSDGFGSGLGRQHRPH